MKKITKLMALAIAFLFQGCTGQEVARSEITGIWIAEDGGKFTFSEDGTFKVESLAGSKFFSGFDKYENKTFNETGKWELKENYGRQVVAINIDRSETLQTGFSTQFEISGEGTFGDNPTWYLFVWVGDPDDMNKYKFEKQKE